MYAPAIHCSCAAAFVTLLTAALLRQLTSTTQLALPQNDSPTCSAGTRDCDSTWPTAAMTNAVWRRSAGLAGPTWATSNIPPLPAPESVQTPPSPFGPRPLYGP